jgi:vancomycin resistance protein YoaR
VRRAWLVGGTATVGLVERPPATGKEQVDALIADLATPAVAAPVTVTVGDKSLTLSPKAIAKGLVFRADDNGLLTPSVDGRKLHAAAAKEFAAVEKEPEQATITVAGGKPKILAGSPGDLVDLAKLGPALLAVLPDPAPRSVVAVLSTREAATTEGDLAELGVKEKVSTFTTYFTGGSKSPRSQNIMTVARAVDGAVVRPGETFSLNKHTGERDYASGYRDAPVIVGGKLEPGVGGGASQFTTTLFNAAYYAGLEDVEHKPHSFYFSRYPAVIESTIFYPTLDLKFRNTTSYGVLIDTSYTSKSVTVSLWSTKVYDSVKTVRSPRRNVTSPPTIYREPGPKCIATSGLPGFTQDAWRVIRKDGKEVEREKFTWRYDPEPRFICGVQP